MTNRLENQPVRRLACTGCGAEFNCSLSGACWCSDLLGRLNRSAIAVDISHDMLAAGRSRPGTAIRAVTGDMESLPFRAGVFQQAICLSAIHHVPNIPAAVREIARVLDSNGVALFSEPGRGHADAPVATAAMRDFSFSIGTGSTRPCTSRS